MSVAIVLITHKGSPRRALAVLVAPLTAVATDADDEAAGRLAFFLLAGGFGGCGLAFDCRFCFGCDSFLAAASSCLGFVRLVETID